PGKELHVEIPAEVLAPSEELEGREHAIGGADGAAGHSRREEQTVDESLAVSLHERGRGLFRRERRALHLAAAEGRTVAARQRARVGLHDPHERDAAAAGQSGARDADLVTDARGRAEPGVAIQACGLGQDGEPLSPVHEAYYT